MVRTKPGVAWIFAPGVFRIIDAMKVVSVALKVDLTITSAADGVHSGPADPHYLGAALDIRTRNLGDKKQAVLDGLRAELGPAFTMFIEGPDTPNEHIHCQRKVGTTYTMDDYLNA